MDIEDRGIAQLESLIILVWKHNLHQYLKEETLEDHENEDFETFEIMMLLSDRRHGSYYIPYSRYMIDKMADICGSCLTYFGHTYGGRYRTGCHVCMDWKTAHKRKLDLDRMIGGYPSNVDALIVDVLYKYNIIGEDLS